MKKLLLLILSLALPLAVGFLGSLATTPAIPTWYVTLNKPFFNPPNWLFAPVWTLLYFLMGISLFLILTAKTQKPKTPALSIFFIQLALNSLWSILFFGFKNPTLAFLEIITLWFAISLTINKFLKLSRPAALLLLPYLLWVSFASLLNFAIILLN